MSDHNPTHFFYSHDWIFDTARIEKYGQFDFPFSYACEECGIQMLQRDFTNADGYKVRKYVVRVPSQDALEKFSKATEKLEFIGWQLMPEDDPIVVVLRELTASQWEIFAAANRDYPAIMSSASRPHYTDTQEWRAACENELLHDKLQSAN